MRSVYGREESQLDAGNTEAKFVLIAIQMISEAARFKFMEEAIVQNNISPELKNKMIAFQTDWDGISEAIHIAEAATLKCTSITPTLVISDYLYPFVAFIIALCCIIETSCVQIRVFIGRNCTIYTVSITICIVDLW